MYSPTEPVMRRIEPGLSASRIGLLGESLKTRALKSSVASASVTSW